LKIAHNLIYRNNKPNWQNQFLFFVK